MFPHGASPRRRPSNNPRPYHAPSPVDPHFFQRGGVNGYDVPVHDSLATHDWKPHPPAPPPPRHMENWRKRKHEDHDPSIAKRLRDDSSSSVPSSRHPQSRHSRLSFSPDHAVAGFSRSSPDFGHLPPRPHSHLHPHVHPVPHNSANLNFFANDRLSAQVMTLFEMCQQQSSDLCRKEKWRSWLQRDRRIAEMGRLYMTGSTMSGFATRSSDADLCYVLHESEKRDPIAVLSTLQRIMRSMMYVERLCLIRAKVPILRFQEKGSNLVFDLNVNNTVGIRNTFLLKSYAYVEPRIRPLVVVVKKWARHHQINDASQGTLSSYALALMVLHYLQTLKEPVLPSLQMDFPECFDPSLEIDMIPEACKNMPRYNSQNQSSLGTLLLGFLQYYATEFSWKRNVISVRAGKALPKQNHPNWNDKLICVEEPFEKKNVARAVFKEAKFDAIKFQFLESWQILRTEMDLNSILPVQKIIEEETCWK